MLSWNNTQIMKALRLFVFTCASLVWAQAPPQQAPAGPPPELPNLPDTAVVAEFEDGSKMTMGEMRKWIQALPPESQPMAMRDPSAWLEGWERMYQMAKLAEKDKLDQTSPVKEQLEFQRMYVLAQTEMSNKLRTQMVEGPAIAQEYEANKEKQFKQVKVNAIYIAFNDKGFTEAQAKAKADKLLAQLRKGADFAKLARENSDDETSRSKDGYFATISPSDNIPDALRNAVFSLKQGETSEPVRQPNGFYILRAEQISYRPLSEVRDVIFTQLQQKQFQAWLDGMAHSAKPKFVNPALVRGGK
jgi:peptidyl-prolyl cis-trans isomerase C